MKRLELVIIAYLIIIAGGAVGWVRNIVDVVNSDFTNINGELVVRIIGIPVVFLGAVAGWVP